MQRSCRASLAVDAVGAMEMREVEANANVGTPIDAKNIRYTRQRRLCNSRHLPLQGRDAPQEAAALGYSGMATSRNLPDERS